LVGTTRDTSKYMDISCCGVNAVLVSIDSGTGEAKVDKTRNNKSTRRPAGRQMFQFPRERNHQVYPAVYQRSVSAFPENKYNSVQ
jgi:hypothetical protein